MSRRCTRCGQRSRASGYLCDDCRADEESTDERRLERETGWGAFESRAQARAALGRSLDRDGGWWGDARLERWAHYHELSFRQAEDLLGELHQAARVEVRDYCGARQVRARPLPRQGAAA